MNISVADSIRSIGRYLLFGNIFIAACAFCLFWATCILIAKPLPVASALFVFFATWLVYNFDSLLPYKREQQVRFSPRRAWAQRHKTQLMVLMVLAGGAAVYFFTQTFLQKASFLVMGHLALLSVLYSVPVIPVRGAWWPLRHIPLLKIFLIAYVWSCVTVWLPLLAYSQPLFTSAVWLLFAQRLLFLLPITIIFDIRDVDRDKATGTLTLPGTMGVEGAKYLAWISLLLFSFSAAFITPWPLAVALILSGIVTAWVVSRAHAQQTDYFYALAADGMMLLQLLLLLIF